MIRDDFAGPGGWDEALKQLGRTDVIGVEYDAAACLTRHAAGHLTIRAEVQTIPNGPWQVEGYIASPPCPTFSAAGKGSGRGDMPMLHECADRVARYGWMEPRGLYAWADPRTPLVLEPLRQVADLEPDWVALEQVPGVLSLWEHYADIWRALGYSVWTGVLCAADYGVPQTRRRAILMASRKNVVQPPAATHTEHPSPVLFGETLLPWVSMAEALGWGLSDRPGFTFCGGNDGGPDLAGGSGARSSIERERERGAWIVDTRGDSGRRHDSFDADADASPSRTLTGKSDSWTLRHNQAERDRPRDAEGKQRAYDADGNDYYLRFSSAEPAPSLTTQASGWAWERPCTTIVSSFGADVASAPGFRGKGDASRQNAEGSIKLSESDAALLQSFPEDYPWRGSRTKRFEQIGNAIPPGLANPILASLLQS